MWIVSEPQNKLDIRLEIDRGTAYVAISPIRRWLITMGADYSAIRQELISNGVILNPSADKVLSQGSKQVKTGQINSWLINLNHPLMNGEVQIKMIDTAKNEQTAIAV